MSENCIAGNSARILTFLLDKIFKYQIYEQMCCFSTPYFHSVTTTWWTKSLIINSWLTVPNLRLTLVQIPCSVDFLSLRAEHIIPHKSIHLHFHVDPSACTHRENRWRQKPQLIATMRTNAIAPKSESPPGAGRTVHMAAWIQYNPAYLDSNGNVARMALMGGIRHIVIPSGRYLSVRIYRQSHLINIDWICFMLCLEQDAEAR